MILFELVGDENHPAYQSLEVQNGARIHGFLESAVEASLAVKKPFLSQAVIKSLNYHAIACLHTNAGEYRPCEVTVGSYQPPPSFRVLALMDDFVNTVNRNWESIDAVTLATYVLWRINHIHPFINGNGRTARATCYFVLCLKSGGWPKGDTILPELLKRDRSIYVEALREVDESATNGTLDLSPLHNVVSALLNEQMGIATDTDEVE